MSNFIDDSMGMLLPLELGSSSMFRNVAWNVLSEKPVAKQTNSKQ